MKKYGFAQELFIRFDDKDLINVSKKFLSNIEKEFIRFNDEYKTYFSDLQKYINNTRFIFEPEKLSKKSPLTLINAPWGSGKTFFIENFIKLFIDEKIKSSIFKKMIIIDAWKFSNSKDVPVEFAIELSEKIINMHINNESKEIKKAIKQKILDWIIPDSLTWKLNFFNIASLEGKHTNKNLSENEKETNENNIKKLWIKIQKNTEPTIIFIDNLERLGSCSWDLLKAILKIQEFDNYLIVLPLNLNKLNNNKRIDNSEYPIEKYIDFNHYDLQQDYSNFFNKHIKKEQKFIDKLNLIFNSEIDGEKLSIREVENSFKTHNLFKIKNEYEIFKIIREKIWNPKEVFNNFLRENINYFLETERTKRNLFLEISNKISAKDKNGNFIHHSFNSKIVSDNNVFSWLTNQRFIYKVNFDYLKDYIFLLNKINLEKEEKLKKLKDITNLINVLNKEKLEHESKKTDLINEISELQTNEKLENDKVKEYDTKVHNSLIERLKLANNKLGIIDSKIEDFKAKNIINNNDLIFLDENINKMFDISISIEKLKNINSNDKLSEKQKEELLLFLNNNFGSIDQNIENNYTFDLSKISY